MPDFQQAVDEHQAAELRSIRQDLNMLKQLVDLHNVLLTGGANPPDGLIYKMGNLDLKMNNMLEQIGELKVLIKQDKQQQASDIRALLFPLLQYIVIGLFGAAVGFFLSGR